MFPSCLKGRPHVSEPKAQASLNTRGKGQGCLKPSSLQGPLLCAFVKSELEELAMLRRCLPPWGGGAREEGASTVGTEEQEH